MPCNYKKYPPNWLTETRPRIMKRARNRCEVDGCNLEHMSVVLSVKLNGNTLGWFKDRKEAEIISKRNTSSVIKSVKVVITIAHLDHDEDNHDVPDDRLMAMCQLHHLRYDAKEKIRRKSSK